MGAVSNLAALQRVVSGLRDINLSPERLNEAIGILKSQNIDTGNVDLAKAALDKNDEKKAVVYANKAANDVKVIIDKIAREDVNENPNTFNDNSMLSANKRFASWIGNTLLPALQEAASHGHDVRRSILRGGMAFDRLVAYFKKNDPSVAVYLGDLDDKDLKQLAVVYDRLRVNSRKAKIIVRLLNAARTVPFNELYKEAIELSKRQYNTDEKERDNWQADVARQAGKYITEIRANLMDILGDLAGSRNWGEKARLVKKYIKSKRQDIMKWAESVGGSEDVHSRVLDKMKWAVLGKKVVKKKTEPIEQPKEIKSRDKVIRILGDNGLSIKDLDNAPVKKNGTIKEQFIKLKLGKIIKRVQQGKTKYFFSIRTKEDIARVSLPHWKKEKDRGYKEKMLSPEVGYDESFLKFFPPNFEVNPTSFPIKSGMKYPDFIDHFNNKTMSMYTKTVKIGELAVRFNEVVKRVKKDIKSSNEAIRLCAIMTGIMVETGIRPAVDKGMTNKRDDDGNVIEVETFGLTVLKPEHVKFIRDNYVELKFPGKKTTINIMKISDADIIKAFMYYVDKARKGNNDMLWVTKSGVQVKYSDLNDYLHKTFWKELGAYDFRRLKATGELYRGIVEDVDDLYGDIRKFGSSFKASMTKKIALAISAFLEKQFAKAQKVLSHESVSTTIQQYISPKVIISFLSNAGIEEELGKLLKNGRNMTVHFDAREFMEKALGKARKASGIFTFEVDSDGGDTLGDAVKTLKKIKSMAA